MSAPDAMAQAGAAQSDRAPCANATDCGTAAPCSSGEPFGYQFASVISNGPPPLASYAYDCPRSAHAKRSPDFSSKIRHQKSLAKPNRLSMGNCPRSAHAKQRVDSSSGIHAPYRLAQPNRLCTSATHQRSAGVPPASCTITYDALHRRTTKTIAGSTTRYLYDGWNVIEEHTNDTLSKTHTWGTDFSGTLQGAGGVGGLLMAEEMTGPQAGAYHYHYDGNGNVTTITDDTGTPASTYRYDAFGNTLQATSNNKG